MRFIRAKEVSRRVGYHQVHVKRLASDPAYAHIGFPKPVRIGDNGVAWVEDEIEAWQKARIAERDDTRAA